MAPAARRRGLGRRLVLFVVFSQSKNPASVVNLMSINPVLVVESCGVRPTFVLKLGVGFSTVAANASRLIYI